MFRCQENGFCREGSGEVRRGYDKRLQAKSPAGERVRQRANSITDLFLLFGMIFQWRLEGARVGEKK